jgi:predicted  nucleic acid-binding Zn-ribbon protein
MSEKKRKTITLGENPPELEEEVLKDDFQSDLDKLKRRLQVAFLICLGLGSCLIFFGRNWGNWNIVATIMLMTAYWGLLRSTSNSTANARTVFADSFYYLGFLFTFVALLSSLTLIGIDGTSDLDTLQIVGQMGPALASTVYGMAVRIYLTQFDAIISEPETDVLDGAGRLASSLQGSVDKFDIATKSQITNSENVAKSANKLLQQFNDDAKKLDFSELTSGLREVISSIKDLKSEIDEVKQEVSRHKTTFEELGRGSKELTQVVQTAQKKLDGAEDFSTKIRDANKAVDEASIRFTERLGDTSSKFSQAAKVSNQKMESISRELSDASDRADQIRFGLDKYLHDFRQSLKRGN